MGRLFQEGGKKGDKLYLALRDKGELLRQREFLEQLWSKFEPYAEANFRAGFVSDPHRRFWEMYVAATLLEAGFALLDRRRKDRRGPDFLVQRRYGQAIWVEAVAPDGGNGPDAVYPAGIGRSDFVNDEGILLRLVGAITGKHADFSKFRAERGLDLSSDPEPFVVALNGCLVPDSDSALRVPHIAQALFGIGRPSVIYDPTKRQVVASGFQRRPSVEKDSGQSVSTELFVGEDLSLVSAVIFSRVSLLSPFGHLGGDFVLLRNPRAAQPVGENWLGVGKPWP